MGTHVVLTVTLLLLLQTPVADALRQQELCYILDVILFLYGVILTILYCRLKFLSHRMSKQGAGKELKEEPVYTGLSGEGQETYETLQMKQI